MKFIEKRLEIRQFIERFKQNEFFTTQDVKDFYALNEKNTSKNTINWRIYHLVQSGVISRIGRGKFHIGSSSNFIPLIDNQLVSLSHQIKNKFPFIQYCIWKTDIIKEFSVHQSFANFVIVEVERDIIESVFQFLKEKDRFVYLKPKKDIVENYLLDMPSVVIVQHLVSEAPIQKIKKTPTITLEKLLVDLVFGKDLFYFYQGYELINIFQRAFDQYTINENKLLRYASRRGKKEEIIEITKTINRQ